MVIRVLVSSCLLGEPVRYHGGDARSDDEILAGWRDEGRLVPLCPEVEGGLGVPRPAAEIVGGEGLAVLEGRARVETRSGDDVSEAFAAGARRALEVAKAEKVGLAVLTARSPSCGSTEIYDGTFSGTLRTGDGVTAALLEANGIRVFTPDSIAAAAGYLRTLERRPSD